LCCLSLNRRHTGDQHFLGAENIFWPVHENRLAIVPPVFRFNVLALAEAAPAAADPDLAGVT